MKFKFDANQGYQLDAIQAVVDLFKGQQESRGSYEISFRSETAFMGRSTVQTALGLGNHLAIDDDVLQDNLCLVQKQNGITDKTDIQKQGKNYAVEMETGTGKTYVYLRTIFEINKVYGFKKFIIVVPSIAIREGVLKSIAITKDHFSEIYNNVPFDSFIYDSKRATTLRGFAIGNQMQIMIINIDSFNKKTINIIHDEQRDQANGYRWLDYIQATNPIVVMDEPQNMESEKAKEAIASLKPLCTLRYSATHRDKCNLIYKLDPVKAFQMRLVKKISVNSIVAESDPTQSYLRVEGITNKDGNFKAKLTYFEQATDGPKKKSKQFKQHDDLFVASKEYEAYKNGFRIDEINARSGMEFVKFSNGIRLNLGEEQGGSRDDIVRKQIRETIKSHFEKELQVKGMGLKVLSLFFLDKVANYRIHTKDGYELGRYAKWFENIYAELAKEYKTLFSSEIVPVEKVHNGYFSKDKKGDLKDSTGASEDDEDTYSLIMTEKEKLLDVANPLKYIFSHSALREGWDNPNVFQICTINETSSPMKKRQEIGRGLRLPVNQDGDRIWDEHVNNLVVIANESYDEFVSKLQKEFEDDCGVVFGRLPVDAFVGIDYQQYGKERIGTDESDEIWKHLKNNAVIAADGFILPAFSTSVEEGTFGVPEKYKTIMNEIIRTVEQHQINNHVEDHNKKVKVRVNEDVLLDPEFERFWNAINTKTVYSVTYETSTLIQKASAAVAQMPKVEAFKLRATLVDVDVNAGGVTATMVRTPDVSYGSDVRQLPDILSYIQSKVELTRSTICAILKRSKRLDEFMVNPQLFMDMVVKEIRNVLHRMIIEGIQYEKLDEISYEMSQFRIDEHKMMFACDKIVPTKKSVYDYILYNSGVEKRFAEGLEHLRNIKYFIKLPGWFKVETPIGTYNPDWAILKENGKIVYMIRETKATKEQLQLRLPEVDKIECGRRHFVTLGVDYDVATCIEDANL